MKELLVVSHLIDNVGICRETVENLTKWGNVKESDKDRNMIIIVRWKHIIIVVFCIIILRVEMHTPFYSNLINR